MTDPAATTGLADTFATAGARGFVHAREIDGAGEVGVDPDEPVVLASVFKILVALTFARAVAAGTLDPRARVRVTRRDRGGGIGIAGCADDVEMAWRDLARFMMTMSDNAATDVVLREIGVDAVRAVLAELRLNATRLLGDCAQIMTSMAKELGYGSGEIDAMEAELPTIEPVRVRELSALDPRRTTSSTPREVTTLLTAIWQDCAGPAAACAEVRSLMADQIWPHRLASGFPDGVLVSAKTGTLPGIRNEAGVVEYADGGRYAVAVFTRAQRFAQRSPQIDGAIGAAARLAVDTLRR